MEVNDTELKSFYEYLKQYNLNEHSRQLYVSIIKYALKKLEDLSPESIRRYLVKYQFTNYKYAIQYYLQFKGINNILLPKVRQKRKEEPPQIHKEVLEKIIEKIKERDKEVYLLLAVLVETGIRIGDDLSLKPNDLNYKSKKINIREKKTSSVRPVEISNKLMDMLQEYIGEEGTLGEEKIFFKNCWKYKPGKNLDPTYCIYSAYYTLWYRLEKLVKKNVLEEEELEILRRTHNFRRGTINYVLDITDKNIFKTSKWIGHKSISNTMKYLSKEEEEEAIKEVNESIKKDREKTSVMNG